MSNVFDIRLRLLEPDGTPGRVLRTSSITTTQMDAASATVSFKVSKRVAAGLETPLLVGLEYRSLDGKWYRPSNNYMICDEDESDSLDPTRMVTFTGQVIQGWLMQRMPLWWKNGDAPLEREYKNMTPGAILRNVIDQNKADHGWAPNMTCRFDANADAAFQPWKSRLTQKYSLFNTSISQVLQGMAEQGYVTWWTIDWALYVHNADFGIDRTELVLGGKGFSTAPGKSKYDPVASLLVNYEGGWTEVNNTGHDTRFGNVFKTMSQSGVKDLATVRANAKPALTAGRSIARELAYEWTPTSEFPMAPWVSFNVCDTITARTGQGRKPMRVIGIVVTKDADALVTVRAVVGDKILTHGAKLAKRAGAATVGTIIGGSGAGIPASPTPAGNAPAAPGSPRVTRNVAVWDSAGNAATSVDIEWDAVAIDADGAPLDVATYDVFTRDAAGFATLYSTGDDLKVTLSGLPVGKPRFVKVRARSRMGVVGEFSPEISVTPVAPVSVIPKAPTGLAEVSNTATFGNDGRATAKVVFSWNPVTLSTDDLAISIAGYQPMYEDGDAWVPLAETTGLTAGISVRSGQQRRVRVRARTPLGVWGDPSAPFTVTGAAPTAIAAAPTTPMLTTGGAGVFIHWDGALTNGAPPAGFQSVYAEYRIGATGPFTRASGPPADGPGQITQVRATPGATVTVRLVLVDTLGRVGATSAEASIVVVGTPGDHIVAGSISVDRVEPSFGEQLQLASNSMVQIIVNRQTQTQAALDQAQGDIATASATADSAVDAAAAAQAAADVATGNVADLDGKQTATQQQLDALETVFWVDADGAHVGRSDMPFQTHVLADRFQITENGIVQTYWSAGVMNVPKAEIAELALTNHKIEAYGTGTVIRKA